MVESGTKTANVMCGFCGIGFYKIPSKMKSKSGIYFCSREHQGFGFRKENNIVKSGPEKVNPDRTRYFDCKNCGKTQKESLRNKSFCNETCKEEHLVTTAEKPCSSCNESFPLSTFHKASGTFDGLSSKCPDCTSEYWKSWYNDDKVEKQSLNNITNREWSKTSKGQALMLKKRLKKYGLSQEKFDALIERSEGFCEICEEKEFQAIDHCHETGRVRGLLCNSCNLALGGFKDNVEILRKAISYLG